MLLSLINFVQHVSKSEEGHQQVCFTRCILYSSDEFLSVPG